MDFKTFPFEIKKVNNETNKKLLELFQGEKVGFLQVGPKNVLLPGLYKDEGPLFYNFRVRPDDVWVVTFPRSGTTFMQEMTWLLMNNLDYKTAKEVNLQDRFPFLEFSIAVHKETIDNLLQGQELKPNDVEFVERFGENLVETLGNKKGRRFIKSHLPFSLLPPDLLTCGAKVIYVARNPKDCCVSFYHLMKLMDFVRYTGDFKQFWDLFESGLVHWGPFWEHINEGWNKRNEKNLLFLFYENLIQDTPGIIRKVSSFLGKQVTNQEVDTLAKHMNIENFRKNSSVNFEVARGIGFLKEGAQSFVRKGKTGSWREMFDEELNERANKWIEINLKRYNIQFPDNCQLGN